MQSKSDFSPSQLVRLETPKGSLSKDRQGILKRILPFSKKWTFSLSSVACLLSIFVCSLSAEPHAEYVSSALTLNADGHQQIAQLLDTEALQQVYDEDEAYLASFPFEDYDMIEIPKHGGFFVDRIHDTIKNHLRTGRPWEPENALIIEKYVKPGTIAIDIGSHIGTHTITMSKCIGKEGKVLAFEPNRKIYRELCYNLAFNHCHNVLPIRCAVGKFKSIIEIVESHPENEGGNYVRTNPQGSNTASMITLDSLKLRNVSFIKIDVENMEGDTLLGAMETITSCKPIMLIEIQGNGQRPAQMGEDSDEMGKQNMALLSSMGYKLKHVGGVDYLAIPSH